MSSPWFQIQPLEPDTYVISEWSHWEQTHCYLLLGRERALLIDTGLGVAPLRPVVDSLTSLLVTAVLTHAHWDQAPWGNLTAAWPISWRPPGCPAPSPCL